MNKTSKFITAVLISAITVTGVYAAAKYDAFSKKAASEENAGRRIERFEANKERIKTALDRMLEGGKLTEESYTALCAMLDSDDFSMPEFRKAVRSDFIKPADSGEGADGEAPKRMKPMRGKRGKPGNKPRMRCGAPPEKFGPASPALENEIAPFEKAPNGEKDKPKFIRKHKKATNGEFKENFHEEGRRKGRRKGRKDFEKNPNTEDVLPNGDDAVKLIDA